MHAVAVISTIPVDDVRRQLVDAGYRVHRVTDVTGLRMLLARQPLDVVVLHPSAHRESSMPELVHDVTHGLYGDRVRVVPMLRRGDLAERVRSLWYGAANVLGLPLRDGELLAGVASVLGRNRTRDATDTAAVV